MGLDDTLAVYQLKDKVLLEVCSSIEKFGWDKFQRHIPSNWSCRDSLNYDSLRKLDVPVTDFINILYELKLKDAMSCLVTFIPVFVSEDLPKEVKIRSGKTLKLHFKAEGMPAPSFKWYRRLIREKQMTLLKGETNSVLKIANFGKDDIGVYACKATNVNNEGEKFNVESNRVFAIELTDNSDDGEKYVKKEATIVNHPVGNPKLSIGASIILKVVAEGEEPLTYEWFKDGLTLEGKTENTLVLQSIMPELEVRSWIYTCMVSNVHGRVLSRPAIVGLTKKNHLTNYHAEDKVALLICNENYSFLHPLDSTLEDVTTLASHLKRENFKVIALRDLDLVEMKNAVKYFCSLLDKGVYAFFYYAGHGFEYNNQRYMQPINSLNDSVDGSLCAEFVHGEIEKRQPRLAALIFDMCRVERERTRSVDSEQIVYKAGTKPNFIVVYATLSQKRAYGIEGAKNGIFVSYLKKYLNEKIPIKVVMNNVIEDVNADPAAGKHQHPAIHHSLPENYSLTDPILIIDENGAEIRNKLYQQITVSPNGISGLWPDFSAVMLTMNVTPFRGCILNGLDVIVKLGNLLPQLTFYPVLEVKNSDVVAVKEMSCSDVALADNETAVGLSIFNLQKLKDDVSVKISLCDYDKNVFGSIDIKLGMPFIMGIDLLQSGERSKPAEECEGVD